MGMGPLLDPLTVRASASHVHLSGTDQPGSSRHLSKEFQLLCPCDFTLLWPQILCHLFSPSASAPRSLWLCRG